MQFEKKNNLKNESLMRNKWLLILSLLLTAVLNGQSLEDFVDLALNNHPQIKSGDLKVQAMQSRENQMVSYDDPVLSAGYNVVPNSMEKFNISLMQNFSWFGTAKQQKLVAKLESTSEEYEFILLKRQIEVDVSSLYFQLQEMEQLIELQRENRDLYNHLETLATNNLSSTKGTMVDVIRAELAKENAILEIELLEQKRNSLKVSLNLLTGREPDMKIELIPVHFSGLKIESAVEQHPEISGVDAKIKGNEALKKAVQKESMPNLGIGIEYMRMEPDRNEFMPMLSVSVPIFRKKYNARMAETDLLKKSFEFEKEWTQNRLLRERNRVNTEISQAEAEMNLYDNQILKAAQAKELLINYYSSSGEDFQEIIRVQQEELNYKIQKIGAETRALQLAKEWEYLNDTSKI